MFYNLSDIWTEQTAEIATSLLNQFNTTSSLLFQVSVIRLFSLQQKELALTSPLVCWTPIHDFIHYRYNNIAAHLFLLKHSDNGLSLRCNNFLTNNITGGNKALKDLLSRTFLRKYNTILSKYNLIYQEQITSVQEAMLCTWSQFIKRPFASHSST